MFDLIVTGGNIVTTDRVLRADIAVKNGKIVAIGENNVNAKETIDASGLFVFPGAIDPHAHLNDPGYTWREDFTHGSTSAACGGVTTIIDMPLQNEPALTNADILEKKLQAVAPQALVDYAFLGGIVDYNLKELPELHKAGVVGYKVFIGPVSPDYQSLSMGIIRDALSIVKKFDGVIAFHAEDYSIIKYEEKKAIAEGRNTWRDFIASRPPIAEIMATRNIIDLVRESGGRAHICHVSHPDVAEEIKKAQQEGLHITAETCPHYLIFTEEDVFAKGALFKCAPPLRPAKDRDRLWNYVEDGTLGLIGSDHSPCRIDEKSEENGVFAAWGGISGIQTGMQTLFEYGVHRKKLCPSFIARTLSENVAKTFGLYGEKGAIKIGFDADLVLLDPQKEWEITPDSLHYLNPFSAFVGLTGRGLPVRTIVRGKTVFCNGEVTAMHGYGHFIKHLSVK